MTTTDAPTGLGLVRGATDRLVLESVIDLGRRTRAEIAQATGVSKPTVSESVRRLGELGVLCEAGRQEGSRGRAGTYYELSAGAGLAVALHAGPHLVVGESLDVRGDLVRRVERPVGLTVTADELLAELAAVLGDLVDGGSPAEASIAISVADPVAGGGRTWLQAGSLGGARAAGVDRVTGSVEVGKSADFLLVDTAVPDLTPSFDLAWELTRVGQRDQITALVTAGRTRMLHGWPVDWDGREFLERAGRLALQAIDRAGLRLRPWQR